MVSTIEPERDEPKRMGVVGRKGERVWGRGWGRAGERGCVGGSGACGGCGGGGEGYRASPGSEREREGGEIGTRLKHLLLHQRHGHELR